MKIAIIAHSLHPIKEPFEGGLEMVTFLLCSSLADLGHDVHLYAHKDSDKRFDIIPIIPNSSYLKLMGERIDKTNAPSISYLDEVVGYTNVMMRIAEGNYDIVHNHSLHYIPIIIGNGLRIPMITSIHTPQFDYLKLGAEQVRNNCGQTFTMVSESLAETWKDTIPTANIVYNGIDLARWDFVAEPIGDYLFWYGRICPEKGTELAIQSALQSGHKIKIAGPISNPKYFETKVAPLLNSSNVEYLGHLSQEKLNPILGNATMLLFTSTWSEPYGLTLAESLACGTPVVAFEGGATAEILTSASGIVVPNGDISRMGEALIAAKKLDRNQCRKRAEDFCSHKTMVNKYLNIYDTLLEYRDYKLRRIS